MNHYDYMKAVAIVREDHPFYSLIMAAMLRADTHNLGRLHVAFPSIHRELEARYNSPGGYLPGESPDPVQA